MTSGGNFLSGVGDFLSGAESIYLFIAVAGSVIFILQFIMSMAGIHADTDGADFSVEAHDMQDIAGLNFFSLKAIVAFITFFGWGGYFFGHLGWGGLGIAFGCGFMMMFLTALVISLLLKMQQSGNITTADLIGKCGTVYLTIPAGRAPGGIVTASLPGCTRQIDARADDELKTGTAVVIREDLGNGSVLVIKN